MQIYVSVLHGSLLAWCSCGMWLGYSLTMSNVFCSCMQPVKPRPMPWRLRRLSWRESTPPSRRRCGLRLSSIALGLRRNHAHLCILVVQPHRGTRWTTTPSSSTLWQQSLPWRRLRTTTRLCSLCTCVPTNLRSSRLWRSCMTLTWLKSTLLSGTEVFLFVSRADPHYCHPIYTTHSTLDRYMYIMIQTRQH